MSKKNPPAIDQGFGDLDDWFNEGDAPNAEGEAPVAADSPPASAPLEDAATQAAAVEKAAADAKAAEEKSRAEARKSDDKKAADAAKKAASEAKMAEAQRQAELEAEARRAARDLGNAATRVFRRKSKQELLAEEDAEDALAEVSAAEASQAAVAEAEPNTEVPATLPAAESGRAAAVEAAGVSAEMPAEAAPAAGAALAAAGSAEDGADPQSAEVVQVESEAAAVDAAAESPAEVAQVAGAAPVFMNTASVDSIEDAETQSAPRGYVPPEPVAPEPLPPAPTYVPVGGELEAWKEAVEQIVHEAGVTSGPRKSALLVSAAHLARTRSMDLARAQVLIEEALKAAKKSPSAELWRERAAVAAAAGDGHTARESLGKLVTGDDAASTEASLAAVQIIRDSLAQDELARAELEQIVKKRPHDAAVILPLLELRRSAGDHEGEASALALLAALYTGAAAAHWHMARAEVLERSLARPADAVSAAGAALAADPTSAAAFQLLDRQWRANGEWAPLASMYRAEGERASVSGGDAAGAEATWWHARAARVFRTQIFNEAEAEVSYRAALVACPAAQDVRREYNVFCAETERWQLLADSLAAEIAVATPAARSFLEYRLAALSEERLGDLDAAVALYRAAATDPAAAPAAEAVLRILQQRGSWTELVAFLGERLTLLSDPALTVTVLYRMGETCEGPIDDQTGARGHYERILDVAPGYLPALEGLERVYTRLGAWAELAAIYEQRAILSEDPSAIALHRHRAGAVYEFRLAAEDRALEQYRLALDAVADFPPSLDALTRTLEARKDWASLARVLRAAASSARDGNEVVSLNYRAGRVLADRTEDIAGAMACLAKCLESSPGFLPAVLLLKELAARQGDWSEYFRLERAQADQSEDLERRHWRLIAAAEAAQRLPEADPHQLVREVLREDAEHPGANELAERIAIAQGDTSGLTALYMKRAAATSDDGERTRACVRVAELAADQGDAPALLRGLGEVVGATGVAARPLRALARVAESLGYPEDALRALEEAGAGATAETARLRQHALGDSAGAIQTLNAALDSGDDAAAALAMLRIARDHGSRGRAHAALSRIAATPAVAAMHALAAGPHLAAAGMATEATDAYQRAFDADPRSGRAFDGLRGMFIASKDGDALRALYSYLPADAQTGLGEALEEAGDLTGASAAWKEQVASAADPLPWSLRLERALTGLGEWKAVFETLQARTAYVSTATKNEIGAKCRWLLAEKLAESDEAWDFYRQLHEARPDDVEVLEALARIAGARGETALAVGYLDGLAAASKDPVHAARVQRRRAEVLEQAGDADGARSAYTRALDYVSDDGEALAGLRRLAEHAGDWNAVVGVLARLAALSTGRDQADRFVEIARIWEDQLENPTVAADSWRKVLELAEDSEALRHLVALSEVGKDWTGFVEYAVALLPFEEGAARSSLMRRIGVAYADHLRREEDAIRYLESAATGSLPDVEATRMLERMYSGRGDWDRVVESLRRRARAADNDEERTDSLARAARMRAETLSDRAGAAEIYEELLALAPNHPDGLRFRSEFLWEAGDHASAVDLFGRMEVDELARDKEDFDTQIEVSMFFYRFAESLVRLDRVAEATARFERALELNPTHLPSLEAVGPLYMAAHEWGRAEKVFRQLLQLTGGLGNSDQLARTYANLGLAEFRLGQVEKSRKRLNKALELRPNDIGALKGLSLVLAALEDWNNLLNVYNNVIYHTHDPGDVTEAYLQKGYVLDAKLNLADKAAQHYEKSLAFDPGQPLALLRLAEIALRRQDWPEAASLADRGLQLEGSRADGRAGLLLARAIAYQACGDAKAAADGFKQAQAADGALVGELGSAGMDDYEKVHEMLRARIQSGRL